MEAITQQISPTSRDAGATPARARRKAKGAYVTEDERENKMGAESMEWYNNFCLVGHTDKRGMSWHYMESMQGDEPNHYAGPIPYDDVVRRLFNWKPMLTRTGNLIPVKRTGKDEQGKDVWEPGPPQLWVPRLDAKGKEIKKDGQTLTQPMMLVEVTDKRGLVRDDNFLELGHPGKGYAIHDYEEWLLQLLSNVIGDTLDIWSAILLRNGAQACVQVALPETAHDSTTGMDFVPYVHCYTSLDSSLATTFAGQTMLIICDNTMHAANARAAKTGRQYKARHTNGSLEAHKITEVQQALSIIHQTADSSLDFFRELAAVEVPRQKWIEVMDILIPPVKPIVKDGKTTNLRTYNMRQNKRQLLDETYTNDPMANTWVGTGLGVVQAINTYATHYAPLRGASRVQRNAAKLVDGEFKRVDMESIKALAQVMDMPELMPV